MRNPWLSIWLEPRRTVQGIVDRDPEYLVLPLAMASGVSEALSKASSKNLGDQVGLPLLLGICVFGGVISGLIGLFLFGFLLRVSGKWLGGTGSSAHLRTAIAWAAVPTVVALGLWIPEFAVFGRDLFSAYTPTIDAHPFALLGFALVEIVLGIWGLVILVKGVAQVHGFSSWRALSAVVVAVLLIAVPIVALALGVHYLVS